MRTTLTIDPDAHYIFSYTNYYPRGGEAVQAFFFLWGAVRGFMLQLAGLGVLIGSIGTLA